MSSKIVGYRLQMPTPHPQEFVDLLYEEVLDQYDADAEVDLVVVWRDIERSPGLGEEALLEVVDYQVMRADDQFIGVDRPEDDDPIEYLKSVDEWARGFDSDEVHISYWLVHKHPEHNPFPSEKDDMCASVLSTIDFVRTPMDPDGTQRRMFGLMPILNRDLSYPVQPSNFPQPTGDWEIDAEVFEKVVDRLITKHNLPEDHRIYGWRDEMRALLTRLMDNEGDDEALAELLPGALELLDELMMIGRELEMKRRNPFGAGPVTRSDIDISDVAAALASDNPGAALDALFGSQQPGTVFEIPVPRPSNDEDFPILGVPRISAPSDAVAAEPFTVDEFIEAVEETLDEDGNPKRPDVPDVFNDIDIKWD